MLLFFYGFNLGIIFSIFGEFFKEISQKFTKKFFKISLFENFKKIFAKKLSIKSKQIRN